MVTESMRMSSSRQRGGSNVAATRSRHGVLRSQARSTTYASPDSSFARRSAAAASGSFTESISTTCAICSSASTASGCPCGDHTSVWRSVTTSGSTIVSSFARCFSPTSSTTRSRMSARSSRAASPSIVITTDASIVSRRRSTLHTIVREAW